MREEMRPAPDSGTSPNFPLEPFTCCSGLCSRIGVNRAINTMAIGLRCLGTSPKKSSKEGAGQTGVPINFGGVTFRPGDHVYADADGVLVSARKLL